MKKPAPQLNGAPVFPILSAGSAAAGAVRRIRCRPSVGSEGAAAATGTGGVRVVDREASAHDVLYIIDFAASQKRPAALIDHHAHPAVLEDAVTVKRAVINGHAVAVA